MRVMKSLKICVFLAWTILLGPVAYAVPEVDFSGEFDILATLYQLPTRDQGTVAVSLPSLKFDVDIPLRANNEVVFQLESTERRDGTSKRYDTQLKEAYLSLVSLFADPAELRYGLVPNYWLEIQKENWGYDFWGLPSFLPLLKYGYLSPSDLGLMYQADLPGEYGRWALTITNGEGLESDEIGARKQAQVVVSINKGAPAFLLLSAVVGAYDGYQESINEKRRLSAQVGYQNDGGMLALEYFETKDPADAITALKLGAGVDAVALSGTSIVGQGVSLLARLVVNEKWALFTRGDWLNPIKIDTQKTLQDWTIGASYAVADDILMAFSYEYTHYSEQFSSSARDAAQVAVATRVLF